MTPGGGRGGPFGGLLSHFARHPTAAHLALALMLLLGVYGGLNIRAQFFPDFTIETIDAWVDWPGAAPADVDSQVIAVATPALIEIEGVTSVGSRATEAHALFDIEFEKGTDMGRAREDVRAAFDGLTGLPDGAERPGLKVRAWRDTVTDVVAHGPVGVEQLHRIAIELRRALFDRGVTRATVNGAPDPLIRVSLSETALLRHGLDLADVAEALADAAAPDPAGAVGEGGARVRAGVERRSAEALGSVVVGADREGARLALRDVAEIRVEGVESGEAWFVGDNPAVRLRVERGAAGDALAIRAAVEEAVAELRPGLPAGVRLDLIGGRSEAIADRLGILVWNGALGLALVLVFLFLFLSARTAFWVAAGIPAAMAASVGLMHLAGLTLDMMSLFALIICVGVVVDDAIVVGEHADMLARRGMAPGDAAETAARRMFAPVFSASITTIIAFLALVAVGGYFGDLILAIPLTVAMVVAASLIESFLVLPAHMRHALSAKRARPWYDAPSRAVDGAFRQVRDRAFRPFIRFAVRARYAVISAAVAALLLSLTLFTEGTVQWRFFDAPERGRISASFMMLPGATREDSREMLAELRRALDEAGAALDAEHGVAPTAFALGVIGDQPGRDLEGADSKPLDLLGGLTAELIDPDARPYSQRDVMRAWREAARSHPRLEALSLRGDRAGAAGDDVSVELSSPDPDALKAASEAIQARLLAFDQVASLQDTMPYDRDELVLTLTPRGEALGFTTSGVGAELRRRLSGVEAAEFPLGGRVATIEVALAEKELTADYLRRARLAVPGGGYAALSEIVDIERRDGFATIRREDGRPVLTVSGDLVDGSPEARRAVREALETDILPDIAARLDVDWRLSGLAEQEREFLADAALGFALCIAGIYIALAWIFGSWSGPFVVLLTIPFGFVGVIWGHHWFDVPLSMFSVVGLIGMSGIIVNDAIVLVTAVEERAARRALIPSIVDAAAERLRPVFLTTATTVAGLAPLLYEQSTQAQFLKPTVITLAFGLGAGFALVLVIVPAALAIRRDAQMAFASARRLARLAVAGRRFGRARSS